MNPSSATLFCSFMVAWFIVAVLAGWLWSLMKRTQPRDEEIQQAYEYRQIGDALVIQRREPEAECPDCQYGEPCEKCLGVKA